MTRKSMTIWYPKPVVFDLSEKDRIAFYDKNAGKGISMELHVFFKIHELVKKELERRKKNE